MRKHPLITNQYYHIYNRGVDKRDIFMDKKDLERFVLSVKEFNISKPTGSLREVEQHKSGVQHLIYAKEENPLVAIVCYCFNPNHFHFILKQEAENGISEFLKRLLGGYTNYFNKVHKRSGALFQGRFKSHLINSEEYILKIRPYVNINYQIHEIPKEKRHLIMASDKEYDNMKFDLVSEKEAEELLSFYGDSQNLKNECLKVADIIREERGNTKLDEEDPLP